MIAKNEWMTAFSKQEVWPALRRATFNSQLHSTVLSLDHWQRFGAESLVKGP